MKLQIIKIFWKKLRKNWLHPFRLIIRNDKNLSDVFSLRLTPRRIFVLGTSITLLIIMITSMLIDFTPLRVYVPGYTKPMEYNLYKKMLTRVDSIERATAMQRDYLDNFYNVLSEKIVSAKMDAPMEGSSEKRVSDKEKAEQAVKQIDEIGEQLLIEITDRSAKHFVPLALNVSYPTFSFTMPTLGVVTKPFSIQEKHFGIDIENEKGTLITAIADGVVVYIQNTEKEGNILIIQHSGNMISIYKNIDKFFKHSGARVKSGDPIATMGNLGTESSNPYLHFEIWYNGAPMNPMNYFLGN
jgi:murein DD-endopeptidase MepM/ murein hydrolase activator NlpD